MAEQTDHLAALVVVVYGQLPSTTALRNALRAVAHGAQATLLQLHGGELGLRDSVSALKSPVPGQSEVRFAQARASTCRLRALFAKPGFASTTEPLLANHSVV